MSDPGILGNPRIGSNLVRVAVLALATRQGLISIVGIALSVAISRHIGPAEFGRYMIATFAVSLLGLLTELGLGASLIIDPTKDKRKAATSIFWFQSGMSVLTTSLFVLGALVAGRLGYLSTETVHIVAILAMTNFARPVQSVHASLLESELNFARLGTLEFLQFLVVALASAGLLLGGFGILALAWGNLIGAVFGAISYSLQGNAWRPGLHFSFDEIQARIRFGTMIHGSAAINLAKESAIPLLVGSLVGPEAVGLIAWAQIYAFRPMMPLAMTNRLFFPLLSRAGTRPEEFRDILHKSIHWSHRVVAPLTISSILFAPQIITEVFSPAWIQALPAILILSLSNVLNPTIGPVCAAFNALGDAKTTFKASIVWASTTWALTLLLVPKLHQNGYALAHLATTFSGLWLLHGIRSRTGLSEFLPLGSWLRAFGGVALIYLTSYLFPAGYWASTIAFAALAAFAGYLAIFLFERDAILMDLRGTHPKEP